MFTGPAILEAGTGWDQFISDDLHRANSEQPTIAGLHTHLPQRNPRYHHDWNIP